MKKHQLLPLLLLVLLKTMSNATYNRVVNAVGERVARSQLDSVYITTVRETRSTSDPESKIKQDFAFSNDLCWRLTSNPSVEYKKASKRFMLSVHKRPKEWANKGKRIYGKGVYGGFKSEREAQQHMFAYRLSMEPKKVQPDVLKQLEALLNLSAPSGDSSDSSTCGTASTESTTDDDESCEDSRKRVRTTDRRKGVKRSCEMSMSHSSRASGIKMRNPSSSGRFNPYGTDDLTLRHETTLAMRFKAAVKLHGFITRKRFQRSQGQQRNDEIRKRTIEDLAKKVKGRKWEELVPFGTDKEVQLSMTEHDKLRAIKQAQHVWKALTIADRCIRKKKQCTWQMACQRACEDLCSATSARTVMDWYVLYRKHNERFPISRQGKDTQTIDLNPFTKEAGNNDLRNKLTKWTYANLEGLSIARVGEQMTELLEPVIQGDPNFISTYNMSWPLKPWAISRWMKEIGFSYQPAKKSYMVNIHERPDVVEGREEYNKNFFRDEIQESCWIQFEEEQFRQLIDSKFKPADASRVKNELIPRAHRYTDSTSGKACFEFHVDDHELFHLASNDLPLGGRPSVRRNPDKKIAICFGQDESTYMPHSLKKFFWSYNDVVPLRNKSEGQGLMISLLISREFGIGLGLTPEREAEVLRVANERRANKSYLCTEAAKVVNGNPYKKELTGDPLLRFFEYGKGRKGYWDGDHTTVQIEDCIDFITAAFPDDDDPSQCKYNIGFEVDHSQAHAKQLPNGLHHKNFNWKWGGRSKPIVRPTKIEQEDGFLGPFNHPGRLQVGDEALHHFLPTDAPPHTDPDAPLWDEYVPGEVDTYKVLKQDLQKELRERNINHEGSLEDLQARCKAAVPPIPIEVSLPKVIPGYVGKPIGFVELLWRRGFIDPSSNTIPSMKPCVEMVNKLADFKGEKPWLCHIVEQLGGRVVFTPKSHCEIAGRGIEYIFGVSKIFFRERNAMLDNEKRVQQLQANVLLCLNKIGIETVRQCSRRAREYKLAYLELARTADARDGALTMREIERMKREYKSKRSAYDQDAGFVRELVAIVRRS